jgi:serine/threonine-protein kinase
LPAETVPEPDKLVGQVLADRYKIEARLGEGAMGAVYRARHVKVGRPFAVKVLHPRLLEDPKMLQRFEREAEVAGRLRHPNVIGVVDVGEAPDGTHYMVMELASGTDLASLLHEAPMPAWRIIRLVRQLLEGLHHAHDHGLVHRDLKPENVIIEKDSNGHEVPRIVDFGIAILRDGGDSSSSAGRLTTNGLVLGTPHYMAPEQAVADPVDHRIDLFALGIMIYEMLCGKLPFDGSGVEVARANLLTDPPKIAERVPHLEVDPLLEAYARRLMEKSRDKRPPNAKAARELLDLIEKDREAAAASLGVPTAGLRIPMKTRPASAPIVASDHPGTFPPPIRDPQTAERPPVRASSPVVLSREMGTRPTDLVSPVRRRRFAIVAAVLGVLVVGVATVAIFGGKSEPKQPDVVATTPGSNVATEESKPTPPTPTDPKPAEPTVVTEPVDARVTKPADPTPDKTPKGKTVKTKKTTTKVADLKPTESKPAESKPADAKPVEPKPADPKPADPKPADPKPAEFAASGPMDAAAFAKLYSAVSVELNALETAKGAASVADLRARFRLYRYSEAVASQSKRDEAATVFRKIRAEIATRSK